MKTVAGLTMLAAAALSCGSDSAVQPPAATTGPAHIRLPAIERHAEQLERGIGARRAGSQEELVAASYILAHLQKAGYLVRLDFVPVENLVRSSNVVALPPGNEKPTVAVTVAYDGAGGGNRVGMFLELARALHVRAPEHSVEFVALGAEKTQAKGGRLGSRRLARVLLDEGRDVLVVVLGEIATDGSLEVRGDTNALRGVSLAPQVTRVNRSTGPDARGDPLFERAGLRNVTVSGGAEEVGRVLLDFLSATAD